MEKLNYISSLSLILGLIFTTTIQAQDNLNIEINDEGGSKIIRIQTEKDGEVEVIEWDGDGEMPADIQKKLDELNMDLDEKDTGSHKTIRIKKSNSNQNAGCLGVMLFKKVEVENEIETIEGESDQGVDLGSVVKGSAADLAGLKEGDIIAAIDGQACTTVESLTSLLGDSEVGEQIEITYLRNGKANTVNATLQPCGNSTGNWEEDIEIEIDEDGTEDIIIEYNGKKIVKKKMKKSKDN